MAIVRKEVERVFIMIKVFSWENKGDFSSVYPSDKKQYHLKISD